MDVVSGELSADGETPSAEDLAVIRCQRGDTTAFRAIYDLYGTRLYRLALLVAGDEESAKDALQECFIRAWRRIGQFRIGTDLRAWLTTILLNQLRSSMRREARRSARIQHVRLESVDLGEAPPTDSLAALEHEDLVEAYNRLNADQRVAVALRYYEGMTVPEIARQLGTSEGTIKSRLHRAIAKMRTHLDDVSKGFLPSAAMNREARR